MTENRNTCSSDDARAHANYQRVTSARSRTVQATARTVLSAETRGTAADP